jgi:hypothetical protein
MMYVPTSPNRTVTVRRLTAAGLHKTPVGATPPLWCFVPPHFFAPVKMLRIFPYRAQKTSVTVLLCASLREELFKNRYNKIIVI